MPITTAVLPATLQGQREEYESARARRNHPPHEERHFLIAHRFWKPGTDCLPGEEVVAAWFVNQEWRYQLPLSLALRLVFDYLGRHRWLAQSASQIESGMRSNPFYLRHGANVRSLKTQTRQISRSAVKVYIVRLRAAMDSCYEAAGVNLNAADVLRSERTVGNEVGYRLKAVIHWVHVP